MSLTESSFKGLSGFLILMVLKCCFQINIQCRKVEFWLRPSFPILSSWSLVTQLIKLWELRSRLIDVSWIIILSNLNFRSTCKDSRMAWSRIHPSTPVSWRNCGPTLCKCVYVISSTDLRFYTRLFRIMLDKDANFYSLPTMNSISA